MGDDFVWRFLMVWRGAFQCWLLEGVQCVSVDNVAFAVSC